MAFVIVRGALARDCCCCFGRKSCTVRVYKAEYALRVTAMALRIPRCTLAPLFAYCFGRFNLVVVSWKMWNGLGDARTVAVRRSDHRRNSWLNTRAATASKLCLPYVTRRSSQTKEIKSNASSPSALQNSNPSYHCRRAREDYPCSASTLFIKTSSSQSYLSTTHTPWVSSRAASCAWCKHCSMPSASVAPALPSVCTSLP